jgi:signal transduction histidine kinase
VRRGVRSIRTRIALACAGLFLLVGGLLIAATYGLVSHFSGLEAVKNTATQQAVKFYDLCRAQHQAPGGIESANYARKCRYAEQVATLVGAQAQHISDRHEFLVYSLAGLGVTTVLAGGLGWAVGGRILRPLRQITDTARQASQENLHARLRLAGPQDELKELADTFDAMLARLDAAFASQRRFVANASHELRTPLTVMRTLIDVTMAKPAHSTEQLQELVARVRLAVDQSEALIEALLTLARSDRGVGTTELVDLPTAVDDAIDLVGPRAAAKAITIDASLAEAQTVGDRVLLERLVTNLLDNAARYNVAGGWIQVMTRSQPDGVRLTVANSGQEVPAERVPELFEPFRRLNDRVAAGQGNGLGLSIVQSVVAAHGGQLSARPLPGGGLEVQIGLPGAGH